MARRRANSLLPIEVDILSNGMELRRFHGFELAKAIAADGVAKRLTAHGTLYKALGRLEERGLLDSDWEDPAIGAAAGRPRRRLYAVTGAGQRALVNWEREQQAARGARPVWEPGT